jgi:WD40 repeat protein
MLDEQGHDLHLVFGTRHRAGLEKMKTAMCTAVGAAISLGAQARVTGCGPVVPRPSRLEEVVADRTGYPAWNVSFSPDGMLLAAGGVGPTSVYDLATALRIGVLPAPRDATVTSLAFGPDDRTLIVPPTERRASRCGSPRSARSW